jgi:hypothetical protein
MMEESTWFMAPGLWEMQVVKLVRILRVEVVSCFTPFKKVLFYFHTKSIKEKKRERREDCAFADHFKVLQVIIIEDAGIISCNYRRSKDVCRLLFFHTKSLKEKKREKRSNTLRFCIISKFYKPYSPKMQELSLVTTEEAKMFAWCCFSY